MGLVGDMDMTDNMMIRSYRSGKGPFLERKKPRELAQKIKEKLEVMTPSISAPVRQMSGGNVQKVLVGREIAQSPKVLLVAFPTRGVDVNTSHVIYGLLGLKTHSKITLVVRREENGIRRYVHLGTGNYNDSTAKLYTDCGILTCSARIGEDATAVFNMLSGYSEPRTWNKLVVAPIWMRDRFIHQIEMEREYALKGRKARIVAKMNSLCDRDIIAALYAASAAGVKIDLIVRGICCLKTGIPGISENITVRSIVGNFLEHSRIFYFYSDGHEEIFMGSADWMPRNLDKRVEIVFPVEDEKLKEEVKHILEMQLADNVKAHVLQPDGKYEKIDKRGKVLMSSQDYFCEEAWERAKLPESAVDNRVFIPAEAPED